MKKLIRRLGMVLGLVLALSLTLGFGVKAESRNSNWMDFEKLYPRLAPGEEMQLHVYSTRGIHVDIMGSTDPYTRVIYDAGKDDTPIDQNVTLVCGANEKAKRVNFVFYNGPVADGRYDIVTLIVDKPGSYTDGKPSNQAGKKIIENEAAQIDATSAVFSDANGASVKVETTQDAHIGLLSDAATGNAIASFSIVDNGRQAKFTVSGVSYGFVDCTVPLTDTTSFTVGISDTDKAALAERGIVGVTVNGTAVRF